MLAPTYAQEEPVRPSFWGSRTAQPWGCSPCLQTHCIGIWEHRHCGSRQEETQEKTCSFQYSKAPVVVVDVENTGFTVELCNCWTNRFVLPAQPRRDQYLSWAWRECTREPQRLFGLALTHPDSAVKQKGGNITPPGVAGLRPLLQIPKSSHKPSFNLSCGYTKTFGSGKL